MDKTKLAQNIADTLKHGGFGRLEELEEDMRQISGYGKPVPASVAMRVIKHLERFVKEEDKTYSIPNPLKAKSRKGYDERLLRAHLILAELYRDMDLLFPDTKNKPDGSKSDRYHDLAFAEHLMVREHTNSLEICPLHIDMKHSVSMSCCESKLDLNQLLQMLQQEAGLRFWQL